MHPRRVGVVHGRLAAPAHALQPHLAHRPARAPTSVPDRLGRPAPACSPPPRSPRPSPLHPDPTLRPDPDLEIAPCATLASSPPCDRRRRCCWSPAARPRARTSGASTGTTAPAASPIVFNGQGNNLDAYASQPPFTHQRVITTIADDPNGLDINAQICFFPDGSDRFVAGEDAGQTTGRTQGWGIFQLSGQAIGELGAKEVGKLVPTFQGSKDNAENYGCGFLSDGRIVTTDVGNQAEGQGDGQLIVWFPPFDTFEVPYCKVDIAIATAQSIWVDDQDQVYVASARPPAFGGQSAGVWRYTDLPTSPDASGGCGQKDGTGAPQADAFHKDLFIAGGHQRPVDARRHRRRTRRPPVREQRDQRRHQRVRRRRHVRPHRPAAAGRREPGPEAVLDRHAARHRRGTGRDALLRRHRHRERARRHRSGRPRRHGAPHRVLGRRTAGPARRWPPTSTSPTASACSSPAPDRGSPPGGRGQSATMGR